MHGRGLINSMAVIVICHLLPFVLQCACHDSTSLSLYNTFSVCSVTDIFERLNNKTFVRKTAETSDSGLYLLEREAGAYEGTSALSVIVRSKFFILMKNNNKHGRRHEVLTWGGGADSGPARPIDPQILISRISVTLS